MAPVDDMIRRQLAASRSNPASPLVRRVWDGVRGSVDTPRESGGVRPSTTELGHDPREVKRRRGAASPAVDHARDEVRRRRGLDVGGDEDGDQGSDQQPETDQQGEPGDVEGRLAEMVRAGGSGDEWTRYVAHGGDRPDGGAA